MKPDDIPDLTDDDLPGAPPDAFTETKYIAVPGGNVFAKKIATPSATGVPLVALHGGPGFPSYYFEPLTALAADRPVILFDQLGCGRSDRPDDASLWTIERFADELAAVLTAFEAPRYHLLGHSWGAMLATRYISRHGPARVASIIMSSPALQVDWWERDCNALVDALPEPHRSVLQRCIATGIYEGDGYDAAHHAFYKRHVSKRGMSTQLFQQTIAEAGLDVYMKIQGAAEFCVIGDMKGWDFRPEIAELTVPVLYLTGAEDEARPNTVAEFATLTPGSRMIVIPDSAHVTTLDNAGATNLEIARFLGEVDAGH
jgi:proline iminopeptidase